jgi:hypothetical protein
MTSARYTEQLIDAEFKTAPYSHQYREFEHNAEAPARALAWTMRTGKSKITIDRACHLFRTGLIDGVLIFAPNGVHANWIEREFPAHAWDGVPLDPIIWRSTEVSAKAGRRLNAADQAEQAERAAAWWARLDWRKLRKNPNLMVLAVNSESMTRADVRRVVSTFIKHRRVLVVFDESDDFGIPGSKRTKMARALARKCPFRLILSGTMVTANPLAAYTQYELLERHALGFDDYAKFVDEYAEYKTETTKAGRKYPKLVEFKNLDDLRARMAKFTSVVLREECHDMPDLLPEERRITPSEEQMKAYRDLHESIMVEVERGTVSIGERANRLGKLQQVMSGFVIDDRKRAHRIRGINPRLEQLSEDIYLAPGKAIVWCEFQHELDQVAARLLVDGHAVVQYHGRVSDKDKAKALQQLREQKGKVVLVGHVQSCGRGQNMAAADWVIWYSHTFKARFRAQALERATEIGGKNITVIDYIAPGPDAYILSRTRERIDIANDIAGVGMRDFLKGIAL